MFHHATIRSRKHGIGKQKRSTFAYRKPIEFDSDQIIDCHTKINKSENPCLNNRKSSDIVFGNDIHCVHEVVGVGLMEMKRVSQRLERAIDGWNDRHSRCI